MYQLLIEAGGLRQIARINADSYERILTDINAVAGDSGFFPELYDGDDIYYRADPPGGMEPKQVVQALQRILDQLAEQRENLLDYVVLLHASDNKKTEPVFLEMQDLLRFARDQECAYVTTPVLAAIRSVIESDNSGPLARITAFRGDPHRTETSLRDSLVPVEEIERLLGVIRDSESGRICVRGPEASVPMELIQVAAERLSEDGDTLTVPVYCSETLTPSGLYAQIVQALPLDLSRSGSENDTIPVSLLPVLHERFYGSAGSGTATDTEPGELRVTARHLLEGVALRVSRIVVLLHNLDICPEPVRSAVDPLFADVVFDTACIVLASTVEDLSDDGWEQFVLAHEESPSARVDHRFGAALEYWETLPHQAADRDPLVATGMDRELRSALAVIRAACETGALRLLYLIDQNDGVLHGEYFDRLFPHVGVSLAERSGFIKELEHRGLIVTGPTYRIHPGLAGSIGVLLGQEERERIDDMIRATIETLVDEGAIQFTPRIWEMFERVADGSGRSDLRHTYLHSLAARGAITAFDALPGVRSTRARAYEDSYRSARIRLHLRDSRGPDTCKDDAVRLAESTESEELTVVQRIDAQLSLGEWELAGRRYDEAMRLGKRAIMLQQSSGDDHSLAASHLLIARIMLAQRRIADAGHYLNFAREEASRDRGTYLIAEMLDATRYFLVGNLSRATLAWESQIEPLARFGFTDWMLMAWFGRARVAYELGDYHGCAELCRGMERFAGECGFDTPLRVARAWRIRAELLTEGPASELLSQLRDLPETGETLLVEAEYFLREGRWTRGIELLDRGIEAESEVDRWPRIGVCWDSGFASMEDLLLANQPGSTELLRILSALRAWALGREGRTEEAIDTFYRLTRTGDGMAEDPYTSFYTYLYASILPEERSRERDDRVTVLGKSVKILQERTSRIDDYRDKIRFLRHNTWNRRVMESAQRHNLV